MFQQSYGSTQRNTPRGTKRVLDIIDLEKEEQLSPLKKLLLRKSVIPSEFPVTIRTPKRDSVIVDSVSKQQHQEKMTRIDQNNASDFQNMILAKLNLVSKIQLNQTNALWFLLTKLGSNSSKVDPVVVKDEDNKQEFSMPETMTTLAQMDEFERKLHENTRFREKAVEILVKLGGNNMKQSVRIMLDRLMHDNLQAQFSFSGKQGKYILAAFRGIIGVLLESCYRNPNIREKANAFDLKTNLVDCLKNASDRVLKRHKKLLRLEKMNSGAKQVEL